MYNSWLENRGTQFQYYNYTYGERFRHYPYNSKEPSGKERNVYFEFNQIEAVIELLKEHPTTRKACISTWFPPVDLGHPYAPCNMIMQLRILDKKLNWTTVVRSLDVLRGFSENLFMFTMWQEYVAKKLGVGLGIYRTVALNAHIYQEQIDGGYCKQNILDCYDYYVPKPAFEEDFPSKKFMDIDKMLFTDGHKRWKILKEIYTLPDYWKNWKKALVADWYRKSGDISSAEDIISVNEYSDSITNEFLFSVVRRMIKEDKKYVNLLSWGKQKKFLEEMECKRREKKRKKRKVIE